MAAAKVIFIVDDDTDLTEELKQVLCELGFQVHTATNGEDAYYRLKEIRPDLVILDLKMPRMSGVSLFYCIRSQDFSPNNIPILITSGEAELIEAIDERATEGVIQKPFSLDVLMEEVSRILKDAPAA